VKIIDRIRGSIAAKLLLITAGVSIVLALIISVVEIRQEREASIGDDQREARAAVMANLDTLALAVWSFDERLLGVTAGSLVHGTSIFHIEVIEDRETRLKLDRPGAMLAADYMWEVPLLRPNSDQRIGTLKVSESYEDVRAALTRRAGILVVSELTKIFATSSLVFFVAYLLITRPLRILARKVQTGDAGDQGNNIAIGRPLHWGRDELDALIEAINASSLMRRRMEVEQRRQQAREANAGKLEALGQLAGGIAHDFNNILGAILGFAGLLKEDVSDKPEQRRFVQRILFACERGRDIIAQIRTFARAEGTERKIVDLIRLARQDANLVSVSLPKSTRLRFDAPNGDLPVFGSEALLTQLISNLCINASEALEGHPGEVRMSAERASANELERLRSGIASPGERLVGELGPSNDYACLRVSDLAGGISDANLDRIFEPFFTTKGRQRGTGLGLAVVHGVVESHGGACHVVSRLGEGTAFSVYLPLRTSPVAEPPRYRAPQDLQGRERILIVDDEQDIVDMLSIGLERLGYETVGVTDPVEALAAFQEDPTAWDIVVTDEVMPQMRGLEFVRMLKSVRPEIKVVLCTGYSDTTNGDIAPASGIDAFLLKPVDAANIAAKLRQLMDAAPAR
jgi:signal transduction histidine kinase/ActR/RegA family two-component response regulator